MIPGTQNPTHHNTTQHLHTHAQSINPKENMPLRK